MIMCIKHVRKFYLILQNQITESLLYEVFSLVNLEELKSLISFTTNSTMGM